MFSCRDEWAPPPCGANKPQSARRKLPVVAVYLEHQAESYMQVAETPATGKIYRLPLKRMGKSVARRGRSVDVSMGR